jgi:pre-mRNA-processing factor 19
VSWLQKNMFCAISGQVPRDPVFAVATGHVYERQLIEKSLNGESGCCPVTGLAVSLSDLISVKSNPAIAPRPPSATSITNMLQLFQSEWDAVLLETHTLKKQLYQTQQQLSQSLYQNDAANRVIAKLLKERDDLRSKLAEAPLPSQAGATVTISEPVGLPDAMVASFMEYFEENSSGRKSRPLPEGFVAEHDIQNNYDIMKTNVSSVQTQLGFRCIAVHPDTSDVLVGCADGEGKVFSFSAPTDVRATGILRGHTEAITGVSFLPEGRIATSSADRTVKVWKKDSSDENNYSPAGTLGFHKGPVNSLVAHVGGKALATASDDCSWAFWDLEHTDSPVHVSTLRSVPTAASVHADGILLGFGVSSNVTLWDVRTLLKEPILNLEGHSGEIASLSFSNNGYHLVSAGEDGIVNVWDLRKANKGKSPVIGTFGVGSTGAPVRAVCFDYSGNYVAAGGNGVSVVKAKKCKEPLYSVPSNDDTVHGVAFSRNASFVATISENAGLQFFGYMS